MANEPPNDYARIVQQLEQKRAEWDLAKTGAKTPEQRAAVDQRYGENIRLMEKERDDIRAAKPGLAKLHDERRREYSENAKDVTEDKDASGSKDATPKKDKGREP
jgi:hypothetical protein